MASLALQGLSAIRQERYAEKALFKLEQERR